jgi:hypothetical protein
MAKQPFEIGPPDEALTARPARLDDVHPQDAALRPGPGSGNRNAQLMSYFANGQ